MSGYRDLDLQDVESGASTSQTTTNLDHQHDVQDRHGQSNNHFNFNNLVQKCQSCLWHYSQKLLQIYYKLPPYLYLVLLVLVVLLAICLVTEDMMDSSKSMVILFRGAGFFVIFRGIYEYYKWNNQDFDELINLSVNLVQEVGEKYLLRFRTLEEDLMSSIFKNPRARDLILAAGIDVEENGNPVLALGAASKGIMMILVNFLSSKFAIGYLYDNLFASGLVPKEALDVINVKYVCMLTLEKWVVEGRREHTSKYRAMLISVKDLEMIVSQLDDGKFNDNDWVFEAKSHEPRLKTLRHMAETYKRDPKNVAFVELSLPYLVTDEEKKRRQEEKRTTTA